MAAADPKTEREALHTAIQAVLDEHEGGAYLVGWLAVMEVSSPDGRRILMTRTGTSNNEGIACWQGLGYLKDALVDFEDQSRASRIDADD